MATRAERRNEIHKLLANAEAKRDGLLEVLTRVYAKGENGADIVNELSRVCREIDELADLAIENRVRCDVGSGR